MKYIITLVLSILITFTAGFVMPKTFDTIEELPTATFGFPLPIFFQQIRGYEKMIFPAKINFVSPWENPVHLLYGNLLIDIIFYWGGDAWYMANTSPYLGKQNKRQVVCVRS